MSEARDFWSRRRAAVAEEEARAAKAAETRVQKNELAEREARSDAEILAELDLPDPDTLQAGDDIRAFMAKAVPERLRRRALRQLWRLNPVLANVDGLVDYGGDFTDSALVVENLQTTYQVGKGMLAHIEEMARQAEAEEAARARAEAGADDETEMPAPPECETEPEALTALQPPSPPPDDPEPGAPEETGAEVPRPRRMRFAFQD
jgi:hypothetical protein